MFTIVDTTIGALLLHQATTSLLFYDGSILGVSGLLRTFMRIRSLPSGLVFIGIALSWAAMRFIAPEVLPEYPDVKWDQGTVLFALGTGVLVGWGTEVRHQ